jgi:hypothetical protein
MRQIIDRRIFFKVAASGVGGCFVSPTKLFSQPQSAAPVNLLNTARNCIFILLHGAPSQVDTFDLKVGPWTPPEYAPTTINGLDWPGGLLPQIGAQISQNRVAIVRSCQAPALIHSLQQTWTQTGRSPSSPSGAIAPNVGSIVALEKESERQANQPVPGFLALSGGVTTVRGGYFPGRYSPFTISRLASSGLADIRNLAHSTETAFDGGYQMLRSLDGPLVYGNPASPRFEETFDIYSTARAMMYDDRVTEAFQFTSADSLRYGNSVFGQQCLIARNVLKANLGVRYIQINFPGWDHHSNIYNLAAYGLPHLTRFLDPGLAVLLDDLAGTPGTRGTLLDDTLVIVRGEFGRVVGPLNSLAGRDHYFNYAALVAGGGVRGGRAIGQTTSDGAQVDNPGWSMNRPIYHEDFAATTLSALGINYRTTRTDDPLGLGFQYVADTATRYVGEPITELFR